MNILLCPCGGKDASSNYNKTIIEGICISEIEKYLNESQKQKLYKIYPGGKAKLWGFRGLNHNNIFNRLNAGDIALFQKYIKHPGIVETKATIVSSAKIVLLVNSKELADYLWGGKESNHNVFSNIIFLKDIDQQNILLDYIWKTLNFPKNRLRRATLLSSSYSNIIIDKYHLDSKSDKNQEIGNHLNNKNACQIKEQVNLYIPKKATQDEKNKYKDIIESLENEVLDKEVTKLTRVEQTFLRNYLFGGKDKGVCGICGRELPISMLTTSHIKKRCDCSHEEKLDFENIVMPMCNCGCDKAFEEGYIYVDDEGYIQFNKDTDYSEDLLVLFNNVIGKKCSYFNNKNAKYFKYRREHSKK